jgi:hypothetical protein
VTNYTKEEVDAMAERVPERVIVAVALPPKTGQPLTNFTYGGHMPDKKFIRENGPSEAYSNAEDYEDAD